ncbi:UPF0481 protein At3g47200-like [Syzygium oleosum]|uniref:UPF0481 protein At3g47200-like n=1 Tax=Syzygium oleosum TaxID=219896 RepID=UPI0011D21FEF|nr:UPF0481 protein At3g47200-like [Syzygium oleosum]
MVLVDGVFIIELFLLNRFPKRRAENDIIFDKQKQWMLTDLRREPERIFDSNVKHLLDALRSSYLPTTRKALHDGRKKIEAIPRASLLQAAGVKFRMSKSHCLFDIKFSKGVLEIPCFKLFPWTESFLRNIMAFEQSYYRDDSYFIDYIAFLGNLINTRADAKLLIQKGIINIENWLGNDETLANLFNSFGKESGVWKRNIGFCSVRQDLKAYCRTPWHKWKVSMKRDSMSKKKLQV